MLIRGPRTNSRAILWLTIRASPSLTYHITTDSTVLHHPSYRKCYILHGRYCLRLKRSGHHYAVRGRRVPYIHLKSLSLWYMTETGKCPVAVLEPVKACIPTREKSWILFFDLTPQSQRNGLPPSLLDFLQVTAMILVTPSDEWTDVTCSSPS